MRGIVQYEVYVLDAGRWSLHARYPSAQRNEAVLDASATESETGRATKVVRDTYWPDSNENEEVTTYLSPKARTLRTLSSRQKAVNPSAVSPFDRSATAQPNRRRQQRANTVLRNVRLIVALGMSLFFASGLTAALSLVSNRIAVQYAFDQSTVSIVLAVIYVMIFAYVFRRASLARLRLHDIVVEIWESADKPGAKFPPRRAMGRAYRDVRAWQTAQERRPARREAEKPAEVAPVEPEVAETPAAQPPVKPEPETAVAKTEPAPEPPPAPPTLDLEEDESPEEISRVMFNPPAVLEVPEGLSLERIILRRFAVDVLIPAIARAHRDDPVTRRGVAVLMAGAVKGLTESNPVNENGAMALLAEAMRESGSKPAVIESFLGNYHGNLAAVNSQALIAAGRTAIKNYVDGVQGVDRDVQYAISVWRFPSTARLIPPKPEFYMFSIAREESLTDDEPSTGLLLHHAIVRAAIQEFGGTIVPHDAAGILAHFGDASAVFGVARAVQTRILAAAGPGTATVIIEGPLTAPGVPEETASILDHARTLLALTQDGEVVSDASAYRSLGDESQAVEPIGDHGDIVRLVLASPASAPR